MEKSNFLNYKDCPPSNKEKLFVIIKHDGKCGTYESKWNPNFNYRAGPVGTSIYKHPELCDNCSRQAEGYSGWSAHLAEASTNFERKYLKISTCDIIEVIGVI